MPVGMPQWSLEGIEFNTGRPDPDGILWILEDEEGFWGSSKNNHQYTPKLNRHGSYRVPGWKERDVINLTCSAYVVGQPHNYAALRNAQMRVSALCSDPSKLYDLVCHSEIGPLVAHVALDGDILTRPRYVHEPAFDFSVQLTAPDPRRYALDWQTAQTGLPEQAYGGLAFDLNFDNGLNFGSGWASGSIILNNRGTAPTHPIITLYGPLETPTLVSSRGGSITYDSVLLDTDVLVIDINDLSVILNNVTTRGHLLNPANFDAFTIPPNSSITVGLSHTGPSTDSGRVSIDYRPAWF